MTTSNRAERLAKTFKVLKKHYKPVASPTERSLLEHLLYACCLENARFEDADEAFAKLQQSYFDWNEIRVTTVAELAEVMSSLPDASAAASRLKRCLQAIFETYYSFDVEFLKKQNLGKAIKELQKCDGVRPFAIAYATQHGLGGHAIPTNEGALAALLVLGVINDAEAKKRRVPGMERAISKSKGVEFGSLLQQFAADFHASPFSPRLRAVFLEIDPDSKQRLPKRSGKKATAPAPAGQKKRSKRKGRGNVESAGEERVRQSSSSNRKKKAVKAKRSDAKAKKKRPQSEAGSSPGKKKSATKGIAKRKPR
jgi:endonuclease-3